MADQPILEPIDERHIDFYGDDVTAVLVPAAGEPQVYVPLRPICDYLGLSWSGQRERTMRDSVLADEVRFVRVTRTNSKGGNPEVLALPLDKLPGWLFGITTARITNDAVRRKLDVYRRDCFRILWDAFKHEILPTAPATVPVPIERSGAEIAYEMATAIQHLARQQMEMEQRLGGRMDSMARWATQVERRISSLELQINPEETITEAQANEIALAVKTVAAALEASGAIKNGYQRVYAEVYRRERIGAYRNLPQGRYQAVLDWLHQWHQEVAGDSPST
jgi:uncharacterized protein YqgV (UPF0045/DUF77 family)